MSLSVFGGSDDRSYLSIYSSIHCYLQPVSEPWFHTSPLLPSVGACTHSNNENEAEIQIPLISRHSVFRGIRVLKCLFQCLSAKQKMGPNQLSQKKKMHQRKPCLLSHYLLTPTRSPTVYNKWKHLIKKINHVKVFHWLFLPSTEALCSADSFTPRGWWNEQQYAKCSCNC